MSHKGLALTITGLQVYSAENFNELSAIVDGEKIYVQVPSEFKVYRRAEFFVAVALLHAMSDGRDIILDVDIPISSKFLNGVREIQEIFCCWNHDLKQVAIHANEMTEYSSPEGKHVASLFSAGVDSSHTLIRHMSSIDSLVMLFGIDYGNTNEAWTSRVAKQDKFAKSFNKQLIPVITNAKEWSENLGISYFFFHGPMLCSLGTALGFSQLLVPSSHTYDELFPWGSHPLSDPLWSSECCSVLHDGAGCSRTKKLEEIASNQFVANNLQVCWYHIDKNCGQCSKCIRTMIALRIIGVSIDSLPTLEDYSKLKVLKPKASNQLYFLNDLIQLASDRKETKLAKKLTSYRHGYYRSQLPVLIDKHVFGGLVRKMYYKLKKPRWLESRVTLEGKIKRQIQT